MCPKFTVSRVLMPLSPSKVRTCSLVDTTLLYHWAGHRLGVSRYQLLRHVDLCACGRQSQGNILHKNLKKLDCLILVPF